MANSKKSCQEQFPEVVVAILALCRGSSISSRWHLKCRFWTIDGILLVIWPTKWCPPNNLCLCAGVFFWRFLVLKLRHKVCVTMILSRHYFIANVTVSSLNAVYVLPYFIENYMFAAKFLGSSSKIQPQTWILDFKIGRRAYKSRSFNSL